MQLFKKLAHVKAGDPITADLFNAIAERLEAFSTLKSGSRYVRIWDTPYGKSIALALPQTTWALLSGSTSPYSWTEVRDGPGGTWVSMPNGDSGTSNCYEVNGKSGLGGKVVPIEWTSAGDWRFQWVGYGCPGGGKLFTLTHTNGCAAVGATVDFLVSGIIVFSGTTDSAGQIFFPGASASVTYTINWSFEGLTGSVTSVGCNVAGANSAVPPGYTQNCVYPTPTLYITDTAGTREIWPNPACVDFEYPIGSGIAKQFKSQLDAIGGCTGTPTWRVTTRKYNTLPGPCDSSQIQGTDTATFLMSCASPMSFSGNTTGTAWSIPDSGFMIHE